MCYIDGQKNKYSVFHQFLIWWLNQSCNRLLSWFYNRSLNQSGRALAQAVSRWLPTASERVQAQVRSYGICGRQSDTGASSLQVLRFPFLLIPPTESESTSLIIQGWCNRPNRGLGTEWTKSHPTPKKLKKKKHSIIQLKIHPMLINWSSTWLIASLSAIYQPITESIL
jgi:hypothetical protein